MTHDTPGILDGYLTRREAARELRLGVRTLDRWRSQNAGPPFVRVGHRVYYPADEMRAWVANMVEQPDREGRR